MEWNCWHNFSCTVEKQFLDTSGSSKVYMVLWVNERGKWEPLGFLAYILACGGRGICKTFLSELYFDHLRSCWSHVCRAVHPMQFVLLSKAWFCLLSCRDLPRLNKFIGPASCRKGDCCLFSWASVVRLLRVLHYDTNEHWTGQWNIVTAQ